MTESDHSVLRCDSFLALDLADSGNKRLADYGARILRLFEWPQAQQNHFLFATLDDFLGVLYALILAKCNTRPFTGRKEPVEVQTVIKRAEHVARGMVRTSGNWMSGFYFNSALFRIAASYHRGLKVVSGKETSDLQKGQLLKIVEPVFPDRRREWVWCPSLRCPACCVVYRIMGVVSSGFWTPCGWRR